MHKLFSLFAVLSMLMFVAAEPAPPQAPADGPDVAVDGDDSPDAGEMPDAPPEVDNRPLVDNPQYKSWSAHEVGTSITNVANVEFMGQTVVVESTSTLLEKNAESATVETKSVAKAQGNTQQQPASTEKITAKIKEGLEYAPTGFDGKFEEAGNETLTIDGKAYDCRIMTFEGSDSDGAAVKGRVWVCDEVPGTHVKGEFDMEAEGMSMKFDLMLTQVALK